MLRLPRMHGSWSIWLTSSTFGFLIAKKIDAISVLTIVLFLLSVEPVYNFIVERKIEKDVIFPAALVNILLVLAIENSKIVPFVLLYSILLAVQSAFKNNVVVFTGIGSLIMTFPLPLITSHFSVDVVVTVKALIFMMFLVLYSISIVLYRNVGRRDAATITFALLMFYSFTLKPAYFIFILLTSLVFFSAKKFSLKSAGRLLLAYQLISIFIYQFLFL